MAARPDLNGFGITEVVLLVLVIRSHILSRHQPRVIPERLELAAQMMRAHASFHPDETRRHVRKPFPNLAARPLLAQDDRTFPIEADDMERILPMSMPITAIAVLMRGMGMLLVMQAQSRVSR